eukprot:5633843-Prymnesium_polylepis.2
MAPPRELCVPSLPAVKANAKLPRIMSSPKLATRDPRLKSVRSAAPHGAPGGWLGSHEDFATHLMRQHMMTPGGTASHSMEPRTTAATEVLTDIVRTRTAAGSRSRLVSGILAAVDDAAAHRAEPREESPVRSHAD